MIRKKILSGISFCIIFQKIRISLRPFIIWNYKSVSYFRIGRYMKMYNFFLVLVENINVRIQLNFLHYLCFFTIYVSMKSYNAINWSLLITFSTFLTGTGWQSIIAKCAPLILSPFTNHVKLKFSPKIYYIRIIPRIPRISFKKSTFENVKIKSR